MATPDRIARLRADLARAEDEVFRVEQADPYAYTNGTYDAACRVRLSIARELEAAEDAEAHARRFHLVAIP